MKRTFQIPSEGDLRKLVSPEHVSSPYVRCPCFSADDSHDNDRTIM